MSNAEIGVIGMGVMGSNLALNIADKGFKVAIWNRNDKVMEEVREPDPRRLDVGQLRRRHRDGFRSAEHRGNRRSQSRVGHDHGG